MRFDPTSSTGVFLGYIVHLGLQRRDEYLVVENQHSWKSYEDIRSDQTRHPNRCLRTVRLSTEEKERSPYGGNTGK